MRYGAIILSAVLLLFLNWSCSTVRCIPDGEKRLEKNKIIVLNDKHFKTSELTPYIRQGTGGWTPFLYVYNWQDGKGKGWDKFVKKLGTAPVIYDQSLVGTSIDNLTTHLDYLGYYKSRVDTTTVVKGKKKKKIQVTYIIELGKTYPLRQIEYVVPRDLEFSRDFYADTINCSVRKGMRLCESDLEKESARSASAMHDKGYYDFSKNHFFFEADTVSVKDSASLRIIVKNHTRNETDEADHIQEKYTFGKVTVEYPHKLKLNKKFIAGLNNVKGGQLYSDQAVKTLYRRFSSVNLFNSVNVQLTPRPDTNVVDCNLALSNAKINGFKVGLEASINSSGLFGLTPEITYYNKNIFHGGERLSLSFRSNHQFRFDDSSVRSNEFAFDASLSFPRFIPIPVKYFKGPNIPRSEVKLSFNIQSRPEYDRNRIAGSFGWNGSFLGRFFYILDPISLNYVKMPRMDEEFAKSLENNPYMKNSFQDQLDAGLTGSLYFISIGNRTPNVSYWYARIQFDIAGNMFSAFNSCLNHDSDGHALIFGLPYSQYVRTELNLGKTLIWGEKSGQAFAMRFLTGIGYAYGNSTSLPFEKRFYSGGANSVRGWVARTLGPGSQPLQTQWSIPNQTGDMKLEANIEYRFLIFWKLAGALFVDAGNVWNLGGAVDDNTRFHFDTFYKQIAMSWGAGIRLDFNLLVLRVDLGLKTHDPSRAEGDTWLGPDKWFESGNYTFHFGVGYPF